MRLRCRRCRGRGGGAVALVGEIACGAIQDRLSQDWWSVYGRLLPEPQLGNRTVGQRGFLTESSVIEPSAVALKPEV